MLETFFLQHRETLLQSYPGLTRGRLEQEFLHFLQHQKDPCLRDIKDIYPAENQLLWQKFSKQLLKGIPLEQINHSAYFYRSEFFINSNVLIPRFETEILVEKALEVMAKEKFTRIADIGTGSGAIILSILRDSKTPLEAFASDLSEDALEVAKINYFRLGFAINPKSTLEFFNGDRLKNVKKNFQLIVSNPPYIKAKKDLQLVHQQVHQFEPHMALYLPDTSYDQWFKEFFLQSYDRLENGGMLMMEGHEHHLKRLVDLAKEVGFLQVSVLKDYAESDRFLTARK